MNATSTTAHMFRWRWIAAGFVADLVGMFIVPGYDWTSRPVQTWLSLILFPFGMMSDLAPLFKPPALICWFAPLPIYGLLFATVAQGRHWRIWCYSISVLHTLAAAFATMRYFRL